MNSLHKLLVAALSFAAFSASQAQTWPAKPIRLIVPYAVGQGTDIAARYVADEVAKELKQPIVVDNRPGAGGNIGTQAAARSAPDGYTITIGTNATHAANSFLFANPGFDPQADFEPIAMVGILPLVYVTHPGNSINTMQDLVRAARAKPDGLNVAISTTTCRMAHELFKSRSEAPMFPIDFKGSAQALTAVMGSQVEYMVDTITSLRGAIVNQQVKPLGVTSMRSSKLLPGVKSLAEQGIDGYELVGWTVFYAPKGTPAEAIKVLSEAMSKTLTRADVQEKLLQMGIEPEWRSREDLKAFAATEKEKWGRLIRMAGLKPAS
ncbi:Bug family tripartite tricarboxylate transporter substrate binding protein [Hydrogenophaga sp. OTU3427]|uniref:Bug family tripartite tricarboxylate transporter substrate binding protein n=1 Tax=Hydrogenophaga sp. OTU3427 TaxID=3043856 RepID=UPI00313CE41B